ncbi:MAG: hypothetical protein HY716_01375 [Planctomycetes bacterium]|nr:hypothetical protein [Planctomycetota bacterium]
MATFLDRQRLKRIFDAAISIRKLEARAMDRATVVYISRAFKPAGGAARNGYLPLRALNAIQEAAVQAFGGWVVREMPDGLLATFEEPFEALRAALHALHSMDLAREVLTIPGCRIALAQGVGPSSSGNPSGPGFDRASKVLSRAKMGEVTFESTILKTPLTGYHDIMADQPRRSRIPGLGTITTITARPLGLRPDLDEELEQMDADLRAKPRR